MDDDEARKRERFEAVDYIKTFAIVAVVFTHSVLEPQRGLHHRYDDLLGKTWVSYHVPSFLAVSGFLYYSDRGIGWRKVVERLLRVLIPYLVASFVALALGAVPDKEPSFLVRLMTGNTQGHYYYVVLIAAYIPFIWILSRARPIWLWGLFGLLLLYPIASYHFDAFKFSETVNARLRNPVYTAVYFVGGWVFHMALPELRGIARKLGDAASWAPWGLASLAGVGAVAIYFAGPLEPLQGRIWQASLGNRMIYTAGVLTLVCASSAAIERLASGARHPPRWVEFISRSTYTIYLYHFFFIYPVLRFTLHWAPLERIPTVAAVAMAGGCLVAFVSTRVLGSRSKWITG